MHENLEYKFSLRLIVPFFVGALLSQTLGAQVLERLARLQVIDATAQSLGCQGTRLQRSNRVPEGSPFKGVTAKTIFSVLIRSGCEEFPAGLMRDALVPAMPLLQLDGLFRPPFSVSAKGAVQGGDFTAPELVELSFQPSTVDVTEDPQDVTIRLRLRDDLSGVQSAGVSFRSVSGSGVRSGFAFLTDGDRLDGVWEAAIEFPPFIRSGEWNLEIWFLHDRADNSVSVRTTTLREMGFPTVLTVVSEEDATPPRLTSIQISPNPVDVTSQDQPLTVALRAMDAQSGVRFSPRTDARIHTTWDVIELTSQLGGQTHSLSNVAFELTSGDTHDGEWTGVLNLPRYSESGSWAVTDVIIRDWAGNRDWVLTPSQLESRGIPSTFEVRSQVSDLQPPELVALDISPRVINVSQTSLEAVCVMRLRDDLSGVVFDYPQGTFLRAYLWLKSPSAVQEALARDFIVLSGDSMDGVWQGKLRFSRFSETGDWRIADLTVGDRTANFAMWDSQLLNAAQLPFHVELSDADASLIPSLNANSAVNAAALNPGRPLAPDSWVSLFGLQLSSKSEGAPSNALPFRLGKVSVSVLHSRGLDYAQISFASPTQVNFLVPASVSSGPASIYLSREGIGSAVVDVEISEVAPGLFSMNSSGRGVAAGFAIKVPQHGPQSIEPLFRFDEGLGRFVPAAVTVAPDEALYLVLFGTGLRRRAEASQVLLEVGSRSIPVLFAGDQMEFPGLDQVNAGPVLHEILGQGIEEVTVTVSGQRSNAVTFDAFVGPL